MLGECGYDPEELGAKRVEGLARRVRREGALGKGFHSGPRPKGEGVMREACSEEQDELRKLRSEVEYLIKAQITLLKNAAAQGYTLDADVRTEAVRPDNILSIAETYELSGVSRSGYCAWIRAEGKRQQAGERDRKDFELILEVYQMRGIAKGEQSIHMMMLLKQDPPVRTNIKKTRRLMRKFGLICPIRQPNAYRKIMKALQTSHIAPNLVQRELEKYGPRVVLLTDITCIPRRGGSSYLSTVKDGCTREILAYRVSDSLAVTFVLLTMQDLAETHGQEPGDTVAIHSDQGAHYTSCACQDLLSGMDILQSMSRRGNCQDIAPQESFFGHMKDAIGDRLRD